MDWAKHRRRKAAAKCHLRLDLQSFLPRFAIIDTAKENDAKRAREVCAGLKEGEIVLFDKAYVDFEHLFDLSSRGVYFVTRAKENMACRCVKRLINKPKGNIVRDDPVILTTPRIRSAISRTDATGDGLGFSRWRMDAHDLFDEQPEVVGEYDQ